jgi:DNA-binding response OmpR family regulator
LPDLPTIAIFAETKAGAAYLADIAALAGWRVEKGAAFALSVEEGRCVLRHEDTVLRSTVLPVKAADITKILQGAAQDQKPQTILLPGGVLNFREGLWTRDGEPPIRLTEKEVAILQCLLKANGKAVSRQALLDDVWQYAQGVETHTLETHIYRLRQKIERDPSLPEIVRTLEDGYIIAAG